MKKYFFPFLILAFSLMFTESLVFADESLSLKQIGPIAVLVEDLGDDGNKTGLTSEELKYFVELRLRQNGVKVRQLKDQTLESPFLYVNLNVMYMEEIHHFIYSAEISLRHRVKLLRNNTILSASTWDKATLAITRENNSKVKMKDSLDTLLTFFLNDYLASNSSKH